MPRINLAETATLMEATAGTAATGRSFRVRIIEGDIWGSSGYYPAEVLERDGPTAWPEGTHVYLDHPSQSEAFDRPERSVRELAGTITSTPVYEGDGLYADVEVFPDLAPFVEARKDAIGMSIRAAATVEQGEAQGRTGTIITGIVEGLSVDFVTHAGAGGRIVSLLESARPSQVVERAVARGIAEATANDTRDALQTALRDQFTGERVYVYVRDFDDTTVWYELDTSDGGGTYQLAYSLDASGAAALSGDPVEVAVRTVYVPLGQTADATESVPVLPAGQSTTQESEEDTMPQIEEARLRQLEEAAGRVQTLESERDAAVTERDQARDQLALHEARDTARPIAAEIVGASASLPPSTRTRVVETAVAGVQVGKDGAFDEAAFRTSVEAARTQAETELAEALQAAGVGTVRSVGHTAGGGSTTGVGEADLDAIANEAFGGPTSIKEA